MVIGSASMELFPDHQRPVAVHLDRDDRLVFRKVGVDLLIRLGRGARQRGGGLEGLRQRGGRQFGDRRGAVVAMVDLPPVGETAKSAFQLSERYVKSGETIVRRGLGPNRGPSVSGW